LRTITETDKRAVAPCIDVNHTEDDTGLEIRIDLVGASKDSINLDMGEKGFCIKAEAVDFRYDSCYMLGHEIKNKSAVAKFDSGLLKITAPFKDTLHGYKVSIH
jgi:HSP20 family molecular chaperone IbpA